MKIIPFNHKKTIKTCGLMNFGSICYLNSFIQSLLSCTCITEFFLSNEIKFVSDNNRVAVEYIKLLKDIMNTTNYNTVLNPGGLFNSLTTIINRKYTKKIFGRGQEDSGEAIHYFLDSIDDENLYKMFKCRYIVKIWCTKCCKEISSSIDESCMIEIPQNFNKMTFNNSTSINEFIRQHVSILSDYKCKWCMTEKCCKLYQLSYAPNIITIMFNKYYDKKIMDFPQNITFPGVDDVLLRYNAVAQIEHSGGMNGGHYWAKCLRKGPSNTTNEIIVDSAPDISYYTLNDSSVSIGNIHSTRETYIVLYHLL